MMELPVEIHVACNHKVTHWHQRTYEFHARSQSLVSVSEIIYSTNNSMRLWQNAKAALNRNFVPQHQIYAYQVGDTCKIPMEMEDSESANNE